MLRNLKVLGLALVAAMAMSAMVASAASAANFTAISGATLTGSQTAQHRFTLTGQTVTCGLVRFHGAAPAASFTSVIFSSEYTECKTGLGTTASITGFGHLPSEAGTPECTWDDYASGTGALTCPSGHDVTIDMGPCVVHIPPQHFSNGIAYINTPDEIHRVFSLEGITATYTDGFLCPFSSTGESATAVYEGESEVIASVGSIRFDS